MQGKLKIRENWAQGGDGAGLPKTEILRGELAKSLCKVSSRTPKDASAREKTVAPLVADLWRSPIV